ncbi:MAG: thymidine phosphorylase [Firmicutes bacterium]|nr:thymidine phosphorylase [[Eubacterium] siraeum]MCM1487664.1 thymidine phosphorylase [Bacillota bacterium]
MNIIEIIGKKRDKKALSAEEINYFVRSVTNDKIPDYQISALLMAIYLNGMNDVEISLLTNAMAKSGDTVDLSYIDGVKVDKHSSGGVGDKVTLAVAPMAAACGLPVAKMSGRGLGFSGGTIDKLEAIPNFRTTLAEEEFIGFIKKDGIALMGQTKNVAPADKKLYALRDVTATVESIPLIAASIMSKKLACGSDSIVLDVKCGSGAFMKTFDSACELAQKMVRIGENNGRRVYALITNMDQPLGNAVGNALEVKEAIEALKGGGPSDFRELCLLIGSYMLLAGDKARSADEARKMLINAVESGAALSKFQAFVENQGGDPNIVNDPDLLPKAKVVREVKAPETAAVTAIDGEKAGAACLTVKAGRMTKSDKIDYSSGFILHSKVGDRVKKGETIAEIHAADEETAAKAEQQILSAYSFGENAQIKPMLLGYIDKEGLHIDKNKN